MRADLALVSSRLADVRRQLASGRRLERASDDPARVLEALRYRRMLRAYDRYQRNIADAKIWLRATDSAVEAVDGGLARAQDLTIQADDGSLGPGERRAIAIELRTIVDEMIGLGNTCLLGRPIFGGTTGNALAYDASGAFIGDNGVVDRAVSFGTSLQVNVIGPQVFDREDAGDPITGNTFETLREIADRVEAGVSVASGLDAINRLRAAVHDVRAILGARLASIEDLENRNAGAAIEMRSALRETEDVDLAEAVLDLKGHEAAYRAALSVTGRILDRSMHDFLR